MRRLLFLALLLFPNTARASNRCYEVSDTVGESKCTAYGFKWSTERAIPLVFGIGGFSSHVLKTQTYGVDIRVGGFFTRYGYLALDWGLGAGRTSDGHLIQARVGPAFGVRIPLGHVSVRVEGVTPLQLLLFTTKHEGGGARLNVEPRLALDWWFTPDSTLSAWAGTSVLRPYDMSFGLSLAAHVRAFDGAF